MRFGSGFLWIASGDDGASDTVTTSVMSTGGRNASADMIQRSADRMPAMSAT